MMGHTPAPWRDLGGGEIGTLSGETVCDMMGRPASEVFKANTRLVTAAPDLLAALVSAEALISGDLIGNEWKRACRDFLKEARAAIAKARGL